MGIVRLYHGTTLPAARRIAEQGFQPVVPVDHVREIAAEFDLDDEDLRRVARELSTLTVTQADRGQRASFATIASRAWRWASRAPETRWELLRAVWVLRGREAWDEAFDGWRRLQYRGFDPAVVVVEAPVESIVGPDGGPASAVLELLADLVEVPELCLPAPVSPRLVVAVHAGPRRIYRPELESIIGVERDEFDEMTARATLPNSQFDEGVPNSNWWPWEDVEAAGLLGQGC